MPGPFGTQDWTVPPSTLMACPVTASLATQNHTAPATSSRVISRPMGCLASSAERAWSLLRPVLVTMFPIVAAVIGVSTKPGQTAFTVTPVPASSAAAARTSPRTPCSPAVYADRDGSPIRAAVDAITTTRPSRPRDAGHGPAQAAERRGQVEVDHALPVAVAGPLDPRRVPRAGAGDQDLDRAPVVLHLPEEPVHRRRIGDVGRDGQGRARQAGRGGQGMGAAAGERNPQPGLAEPDGHGPADAAPGPGDQRDPIHVARLGDRPTLHPVSTRMAPGLRRWRLTVLR